VAARADFSVGVAARADFSVGVAARADFSVGVAARADFSVGGWAVIRGTSLRVGGHAGRRVAPIIAA
jgi:uncharacterized membrane protein YczE